MSDEISQDMPGPTQPEKEHEWLNQLVGEWSVESEMMMPDGSKATGSGREVCTSFGGLWAHTHGKATMPDGGEMEYYSAIGYDVTFKEYRGCWYATVSSHLWKYAGELSADQKTLTLNCEGPDMMKDGETMLYRDVIEIITPDHRTLTSFGQIDGEWVQFMSSQLKRIGF